MLDDYITWCHAGPIRRAASHHHVSVPGYSRSSAVTLQVCLETRADKKRQRIISLLDSSNIYNSNNCVQTAA